MEKKTLLLVEDDDTLRDLLRGALEDAYKVVEASNPSEAREKAGGPVDLAIVDYRLPDGNGFDVVRSIRATKSELPIILITAFGSEHLATEALRTSVTDYIKKPLSIAYLREKLSEILGRAGIERLQEEGVQTGEASAMERISGYIEDNYRKDLTSDELAERTSLDVREFNRAFNDRFGMGVKAYLNTVRLGKAAELLKSNPELAVADIAFFVGFESVAYFGRLFKTTYGMSPSKYRMHYAERPFST